MAKVSFIGLGVMGAPMAGHLAAAGHEVTVYNRTTSSAQAWVEQYGHRLALSPELAARGSQFVMVCVGNDDDVRSVVLGESGALAAMEPGAVLIDHTTASAVLARELAAAAAERGVGFIDAPVSGGQAGAQSASLAVMCGCDDVEVFELARPVLEVYARAVTLLGGAGSGQLTKMVNQICIAGVLQGLSEGVAFAQRVGLDVDEVISAIGQGAAQSWQMNNRASTMARGEFDFGFAVEWMRKDLAICLDEARRSGAQLAVTALIDQLYAEVIRRGGARWDTSSLIEVLRPEHGSR
jgi:3-hydroxyisobutyrate dehydrogenase-like beta-hydroxyacid dehydrogenase